MPNQTSAPPPPEKRPPRTALKIGAVLATIIIVIVLFAYVFIPAINRPRPDIVLLDGHDGFQGLNYVVYVDVGVKNHGSDGWVTVYAELRSAGRYEEKNSRIYMTSGETKQLQFVFDVGFWNTVFSSMTYKAWTVTG